MMKNTPFCRTISSLKFFPYKPTTLVIFPAVFAKVFLYCGFFPAIAACSHFSEIDFETFRAARN